MTLIIIIGHPNIYQGIRHINMQQRILLADKILNLTQVVQAVG